MGVAARIYWFISHIATRILSQSRAIQRTQCGGLMGNVLVAIIAVKLNERTHTLLSSNARPVLDFHGTPKRVGLAIYTLQSLFA